MFSRCRSPHRADEPHAEQNPLYKNSHKAISVLKLALNHARHSHCCGLQQCCTFKPPPPSNSIREAPRSASTPTKTCTGAIRLLTPGFRASCSVCASLWRPRTMPNSTQNISGWACRPSARQIAQRPGRLPYVTRVQASALTEADKCAGCLIPRPAIIACPASGAAGVPEALPGSHTHDVMHFWPGTLKPFQRSWPMTR